VARADFLAEAGHETPLFVRFSTVAGSRGYADTVRDVRGFATKFYTREGNYDLVGTCSCSWRNRILRSSATARSSLPIFERRNVIEALGRSKVSCAVVDRHDVCPFPPQGCQIDTVIEGGTLI